MEYKFISNPLLIERTGYWYVVYGKYPHQNKSDLFSDNNTIKRKYIESERFFKKEINALKYIDRMRKKHWQNFFKVTSIQLK